MRFEVPGVRVTDPKAAQCGEVLKGVLKPPQCKLFGKECNPEHPIGAAREVAFFPPMTGG